jgi:hypothetical protein
MQINAPFPMQSTHLGYRYTMYAFNPVISYAGRLNLIRAHALVAYRVTISVKLDWVQFDELMYK